MTTMSVDHIILDHNAGLHRQFSAVCHICMWHRDHPVLLQLERKVDDLTDEIKDIEQPVEPECDHYCEVTESDLDAVSDRVATLDDEVTSLRTALQEASDIIVTLTERFSELEARVIGIEAR